jgi:hypothetical protein
MLAGGLATARRSLCVDPKRTATFTWSLMMRPATKWEPLASKFPSAQWCEIRQTVSGWRGKPEGYAAWEIHPVKALHVDQ